MYTTFEKNVNSMYATVSSYIEYDIVIVVWEHILASVLKWLLSNNFLYERSEYVGGQARTAQL